ncbi:MAG: hypothetical protein IIB21_04420 [Chloroflexi bacterium]|nr:hypothetical protein [Chloroflexota bacterium]
MNRRSPLLMFALLAIGLALAACSDGGPSEPTPTTLPGPSRSFDMGFSSLPSELPAESYGDTFELAASAGEVILIQRVPPWEALMANGLFPSDEVVQTTQRETELAEEHGLDLFVAIDPTDASEGRRQLAGLPEDRRGAGFADEEVRRAFVQYAQFVALNYQPKYLALGVEINSYEAQNPEDFEQFVTLYHEAYAAVKELSPETLVFPTFQLEELHGLLPANDPRPSQWHLIRQFQPNLDLLAVSTYPGLAFSNPDEIPANYYTRLASYTIGPIGIAGMGYSSEPGRDGLNEGTEPEQAIFLSRVLDEAEEMEMALTIWFIGQDPAFTGETPLDLLQYVGLLRQDGTEKPAWLVWNLFAKRPVAGAP